MEAGFAKAGRFRRNRQGVRAKYEAAQSDDDERGAEAPSLRRRRITPQPRVAAQPRTLGPRRDTKQ
jgi:hypothetical protein